ncbi:RpiB/LacA/LacB family sugar-phosphate isomerase [Candidatus Roizmanbacteria bacterium]|nr:RpiB/LacA/LacB family sugar-phosphate isomerase [Candidatus Roizmanbacteria bacterium]
MTIFIGADHRGFALKEELLEYLQSKNIRVEDMGSYEYNATDDYADFARPVAQAVLQNPTDYRGIVICGSGIGVSEVANRFKGIYCALGFDERQVEHGRTHDNINVLALPSDYIDTEKAQRMVDIFIETAANVGEKYDRRQQKLDQPTV